MRPYSLVKTVEDRNVTRLPGVLTDQPWIDYALGSSINAITGARGVDNAVVPFSIKNYPALIQRNLFYSISSEHDLHTAYSAEAKGDYNTSGLKISASASFLNDASYSESSMTIVVLCDVRTSGSGVSEPSSIELSTLAKEYLQINGDVAFRERYGDYFVSSNVAGSRFVATYKIYTSSSASLLQFQATASVSADIASAEGSTKFEQQAHASNASIDCKYEFQGINKTAPNFPNTPAGIAQALDWFLARNQEGNPENLAYIPVRASLTHFSALSNAITNVYEIEPEVFANIQSLRVLIGDMNSLAAQLPQYFLRQPYNDKITFQEELKQINETLEAAQDTLPHKSELVDELQNRATALTFKLRPSLALTSFYNNLKAQGDREKHSGTSTELSGTVSDPGGISIKVEETTNSYSKGASGIVWERRSHTFHYSNPERIIVGWAIRDNWGDGTNGGWQINETLIGKSSGDIKVEGAKGRGINWTATFYAVPKSSFPWVTGVGASDSKASECEAVLA